MLNFFSQHVYAFFFTIASQNKMEKQISEPASSLRGPLLLGISEQENLLCIPKRDQMNC